MLMLDVRRLRVLAEVDRRGSFVDAARALNVVPSAVSQQIAALERELGVAVVERTRHGTRLTEAGRVLVAHADRIFTSLNAAEAAVRALSNLTSGELRLAAFPSAGATLIPLALSRYRERYPAVRVTMTEAEPSDSLVALEKSQIDLAVVYEYDYVEPPAHASLTTTHFMADPMMLIVASGHPAARKPWWTSGSSPRSRGSLARRPLRGAYDPARVPACGLRARHPHAHRGLPRHAAARRHWCGRRVRAAAGAA